MRATPPSRRTALLVLLTAVGLLLVSAIVGSIPNACSGCHRAHSRTLARSSHAKASCYDCHLDHGWWGLAEQKAVEFTRMYPAALLGRGLSGPVNATSRDACMRCHGSVLQRTVSANGLRVKHKSCANGPTCDGCHGEIAHGSAVRRHSRYEMEECVGCHERERGPKKCESCHVGERQKPRDIGGAWQVTHGPAWRKTHGMGDQRSCRTCHPADFCSTCHGVEIPHSADFGATHGDAARLDRKACMVCHKSAQAFCDECHTIEMPHPKDFLRRHSRLAEGEKDPVCRNCHVETDCDTCHRYHVHPGGGKGVPVPWSITPEELRP